MIEDAAKRKKFLFVLWGVYFGLLCAVLILEKNLTELFGKDNRLFLLLWLLYASYYFSCRAKGENFYFQCIGGKPASKVGQLSSDLVAIFVYLISSGSLLLTLFESRGN